jgi:sulfate/thiosulfate transport system ATP-binding protein
MKISLTSISKRFGDFTALQPLALEAQPGEFLALLGPSGSGKTTLLRIIAGLEFPDQGTVAFNGEDVTDRPAAARGVGFVFQQYALFRHMTVTDNIAFGLRVRGRRTRPPAAEIDRRVNQLLELIQLPQLGNRYPAQLSGGQRQRVALARALAVEPKILLLDEPFGALDAKVRKDLRRWLRDLHNRMGLTSIFVTHDQEEALELADRVVVMDHSVIEQIADPATIYDQPASAFVYDFVGESNCLPVSFDRTEVRFGDYPIAVANAPATGQHGQFFFRPHQAELSATSDGIAALITLARPHGGVQRIEVKVAGLDKPLELDVPLNPPLREGAQVLIKPTGGKVFAN